MLTLELLNERGAATLPGHLGIVFTHVSKDEVRAELPVRTEVMAPNGFLHAGSLVALADTCCGYGCVANLPDGASGLHDDRAEVEPPGHRRPTAPSTASRRRCTWAAPRRCGTRRSTHRESGRVLALFRCTQMVLYAKR